MSDLLDLSGRVALVTGAGQGVGRQIALHFAAHRAEAVVVNDFYAERAAAVVAEIEAVGGRAIAAQGDVTRYDSVSQIVADAQKRFGPIDILVNNAGNAGAAPRDPSSVRRPFWETEPADWTRYLDVNLLGPMHCCRACIPGMIERKGGRIITIISDAGRAGEANMEAYSAAKAGAAGLTRALARSLGRYQITVNNVAIAATITPTTEKRLDPAIDPERYKKVMEKYVIRRPGQPADVANLVLFLASEASSWITGQTYPVNGGFSFAM